jgi:hypothetical protein
MPAAQARARAARAISAGAAALSLSVLADSSAEHYRGRFRNRAMYVPIVVSGLSVAANGAAQHGKAIGGVNGLSFAAGAAGVGFHLYNIGKRVGGFSWQNLFYAAPIGAPAALAWSGLLGRLAEGGNRPPKGRLIGGLTALGLAGTVAEVALLHFRGAFQNPAMFIPLTVPPLAALALARECARDTPSSGTAPLLVATAVIGTVGVGFHLFGVSRGMGGWRNWRQNLLAGPPVSAPPAFIGLALAGLGALALMRARS